MIISLIASLLLLGCGATIPKEPKAGEKAAIPNIRVCLSENTGNNTLAFQENFRLKLEEANYLLDENLGVFSVYAEGSHLVLKSDQRYFEIFEPQTLTFNPEFPNSQFVWNNIPYTGELSLHWDGQEITAVNKIPVEAYLLGVVPYEIPTGQNDYKEAVYAQTIAARSYACYRLDHPTGQNYDIRADSWDQIYKGVSKHSAQAEKAIKDTKGFILANQYKPVITHFHSTCGGVLEAVSDTVARLIGGRGAMTEDITDDEYNCKVSPLYRWIEIREVETTLQNLEKEFQIDSLTVQKWLEAGFEMNLEISGRTASGRVAEMNINVEDQEYLVDQFRIRRILADENRNPIPSRFFFINKSPVNPDKYFIIGAGAGHGKGMCQWGAIGMSLKGFSHTEILDFYYPGLALYKYY